MPGSRGPVGRRDRWVRRRPAYRLGHRKGRRLEKRDRIFRILSRQPMDLLRNRIEVGQLMTRNPVTVRPETRVQEMAEAMAAHGLSHLFVCDETGRLVGAT